jgi:hypothetical protein
VWLSFTTHCSTQQFTSYCLNNRHWIRSNRKLLRSTWRISISSKKTVSFLIQLKCTIVELGLSFTTHSFRQQITSYWLKNRHWIRTNWKVLRSTLRKSLPTKKTVLFSIQLKSIFVEVWLSFTTHCFMQQNTSYWLINIHWMRSNINLLRTWRISFSTKRLFCSLSNLNMQLCHSDFNYTYCFR